MLRIVAILLLQLALVGCANTNKSAVEIPDCPPPPPELHDIDVALVLGGGGARGLAHVGVLEVLEENNIPIDLIVGTSIGSAVGALYADEPDAGLLKSKLMKVKKWDVLDLSILDSLKMLIDIKGLVRGFYYQRFLLNTLKTKDIESLKIPLVIVTTDISNNELYLLRSGPIAPAVHASSAIPPVFSPVKIYGRTLVDGGVLEPVPINVAKKFRPKVIISVDISNSPPYGTPRNMVELTYKSSWLYYYELSRLKSRHSDFDIHPYLNGIGMFDDDRREHMIKAGRVAAEEIVHFIKRKLKSMNIPLRHKE